MKTNYFIRTGAAMLLAALCFALTACSDCDCDRPKEPTPQVEPPEGYGSQQAIAGTANADAKAIFATMTVEIAECPEIETMHIVAPGYFDGDTSDEMELGVPVIYAK